MSQSKAYVEKVVCRISMNIKFITELEELESMISCILFKIMLKNVIIIF